MERRHGILNENIMIGFLLVNFQFSSIIFVAYSLYLIEQKCSQEYTVFILFSHTEQTTLAGYYLGEVQSHWYHDGAMCVS